MGTSLKLVSTPGSLNPQEIANELLSQPKENWNPEISLSIRHLLMKGGANDPRGKG